MVGNPVDVSVNLTVRGTSPDVVLVVKLAIGLTCPDVEI